jgi:hypothetical protein
VLEDKFPEFAEFLHHRNLVSFKIRLLFNRGEEFDVERTGKNVASILSG